MRCAYAYGPCVFSFKCTAHTSIQPHIHSCIPRSSVNRHIVIYIGRMSFVFVVLLFSGRCMVLVYIYIMLHSATRVACGMPTWCIDHCHSMWICSVCRLQIKRYAHPTNETQKCIPVRLYIYIFLYIHLFQFLGAYFGWSWCWEHFALNMVTCNFVLFNWSYLWGVISGWRFQQLDCSDSLDFYLRKSLFYRLASTLYASVSTERLCFHLHPNRGCS